MNMKKEFTLRALFGIPIGISIGCLLSIIYSATTADGSYSACMPELIELTGSEIQAVILQTVLCGLLGLSFGGTSIFWEIERWSLLKQSGLFFLINSLVMMPIAYVNYWMAHTLLGFVSYFAIFVLVFAIIWILSYLIGRKNVHQMNDQLKRNAGR
ncbi:MAG: DUF3021 domain-containing protein [Anaerovoracaceae bacterium]|jgi:hypothetical protein